VPENWTAGTTQPVTITATVIDNTVTFIARGRRGGSATVTIAEPTRTSRRRR